MKDSGWSAGCPPSASRSGPFGPRPCCRGGLPPWPPHPPRPSHSTPSASRSIPAPATASARRWSSRSRCRTGSGTLPPSGPRPLTRRASRPGKRCRRRSRPGRSRSPGWSRRSPRAWSPTGRSASTGPRSRPPAARRMCFTSGTGRTGANCGTAINPSGGAASGSMPPATRTPCGPRCSSPASMTKAS
jgi:hypothetical protein